MVKERLRRSERPLSLPLPYIDMQANSTPEQLTSSLTGLLERVKRWEIPAFGVRGLYNLPQVLPNENEGKTAWENFRKNCTPFFDSYEQALGQAFPNHQLEFSERYKGSNIYYKAGRNRGKPIGHFDYDYEHPSAVRNITLRMHVTTRGEAGVLFGNQLRPQLRNYLIRLRNDNNQFSDDSMIEKFLKQKSVNFKFTEGSGDATVFVSWGEVSPRLILPSTYHAFQTVHKNRSYLLLDAHLI